MGAIYKGFFHFHRKISGSRNFHYAPKSRWLCALLLDVRNGEKQMKFVPEKTEMTLISCILSKKLITVASENLAGLSEIWLCTFDRLQCLTRVIIFHKRVKLLLHLVLVLCCPLMMLMLMMVLGDIVELTVWNAMFGDSLNQFRCCLLRTQYNIASAFLTWNSCVTLFSSFYAYTQKFRRIFGFCEFFSIEPTWQRIHLHFQCWNM